jgi:hypothetical protein
MDPFSSAVLRRDGSARWARASADSAGPAAKGPFSRLDFVGRLDEMWPEGGSKNAATRHPSAADESLQCRGARQRVDELLSSVCTTPEGGMKQSGPCRYFARAVPGLVQEDGVESLPVRARIKIRFVPGDRAGEPNLRLLRTYGRRVYDKQDFSDPLLNELRPGDSIAVRTVETGAE